MRVGAGSFDLQKQWLYWPPTAWHYQMPLERRAALCNSSLAAWPSGLSWGIKICQSKGNGWQWGTELEWVCLLSLVAKALCENPICGVFVFFLLLWSALQRWSPWLFSFLGHPLLLLLWAWEAHLSGCLDAPLGMRHFPQGLFWEVSSYKIFLGTSRLLLWISL